jgi:hypothetical protein
MSSNLLGIDVDPASHPDELAGPPAWSGVTRILRDGGCQQPWQVGEAILERGSQVHIACDLLDAKPKSFRWSSFDSAHHGYIHAWLACKEDFDIHVVKSEHYVENAAHRVRGRLDRILTFGKSKQLAVAELCTGKIQPFKGLQMAAYGWMYARGRRLFRRIGFQLRADGTYAPPTEFSIKVYQRDVVDFLTLVRAVEVRERLGL